MIRVLLMAVIFVGFIGCEFFHRCFFGKLRTVKRVSVGDVSLMGSGHRVIFFVSFSSKLMMFGSQLKVVSGLQMSVMGFVVEFVVVFGSGHFRVIFVVIFLVPSFFTRLSGDAGAKSKT